MQTLLEQHHDKNLADGRKYYFGTGDEGTHSKSKHFDSLPDLRAWIPGGLHENNNLTKLSNTCAVETLGNSIMHAFGRVTEASQRPIANATNTHQAVEFTRFLAEAGDRERSRSFVHAMPKLGTVCVQCQPAADVIVSESARCDAQWGAALCKTALAQAAKQSGQAPAAARPPVPEFNRAEGKRPAVHADSKAAAAVADGKQPQQPDGHQSLSVGAAQDLLRAAKRRQRVRGAGQHVECTPLLQAIDAALENKQTPPFSDAYAQALIQLATCPHGCCSAAAVLAHTANSTDATARNNAALFERLIWPTVAHRHSLRYNQPILRLQTRRDSAAALYARHHINYAKGMVHDFKVLAEMHPDARALRDSVESVSFSRHAGQAQPMDAVCEQEIGKVKHEPHVGDSDARLDAATVTVNHSGYLKDALDTAVGTKQPARRQRTEEEIEPTELSFCIALREGKAFESCGRKAAVDLSGDLLAMPVERLLELGGKRLRKYVTERYLQKKVDLHAPVAAADSAKLCLSVSGNQPAPAKSKRKGRSRARQRQASAPRSRSHSPAAVEDENVDGSDSEEAETMDYQPRSRSVSRSPSPRAHSRERSAGFFAAVQMHESDAEDGD